MTIGAAILLIAVGAVLKWAVTAHVSGFDIQTAGTIVFIVGLAGLVLAVMYTFWWSREQRYDPVARRPPPHGP
jgi:Zn-dependent protease with chaperone function